MRIPTWIIVPFSSAIPFAAMAAEGNPDRRQGQGGGRRVLRVPWRRWRRHRGRARGRQECPKPGRRARPLSAVPARVLPQGRAQERGDERDGGTAQRRRPAQPVGIFCLAAGAQPPAPPDAAPQDTELGGKVAAAIHCTNCHGDHFEGVDNIPRLAGQREDYLYEALRDFKSGARTSTGAAGMAEVVYPLGDLGDESVGPLCGALRRAAGGGQRLARLSARGEARARQRHHAGDRLFPERRRHQGDRALHVAPAGKMSAAAAPGPAGDPRRSHGAP